MRQGPFTEYEHQLMTELQARGWTFAAIAAKLDRWPASIYAKLRNLGFIEGADTGASGVSVTFGPSLRSEQLAERDRRRALAEQRDLTATFCGDPPPGYSALDKRAPHVAAPSSVSLARYPDAPNNRRRGTRFAHELQAERV